MEITFPKRKMKPSMALNLCDDTRSSCVSHYGYLVYLSIVWWLCIPYLFIDASTEGYKEEEVIYEEEENFDHCTNQGKLIPMQALLVQDSKDTLAIYLFRELYQSQVFILQAFVYQSLFIVYLCLNLEILQEHQAQCR